MEAEEQVFLLYFQMIYGKIAVTPVGMVANQDIRAVGMNIYAKMSHERPKGAAMEDMTPVAETTPDIRVPKLVIVLMSLMVTIWLAVAIVTHWKAFDWSKKVVGVCLLLSFLLGPPLRPPLRIFKYIKKRESNPDNLAFDGLMNVLLLLILFT